MKLKILNDTKMQENKTKTSSLTLTFLLVIMVWAVSGIIIYNSADNWGDRGTMGDMFGAINALFSGLAFAAILYNLVLQREEIKLNRAEIALNRKELSKSVKAQQESQEALRQQVQQTHLTTQINAMNVVINYYNSQIDSEKSSPETVERAKEKRRLVIRKIDDLIEGLEDSETD